jgi:uncharacterized protein (TIGR02588 family)
MENTQSSCRAPDHPDPSRPEDSASFELSQLPRRSLAEWITLVIAAAILLVLVGLIFYDWQVSQNRPPAFQIEVTETARVAEGRYYVPFVIKNTGGRVARTVQVTAELHMEGEADETGEQQIDFLAGNERKRGSFVFNHDPQTGELVIRVASFGLP